MDVKLAALSEFGEWSCPLSGHVARGARRFEVSIPCGCVASVAAARELKRTAAECAVCGGVLDKHLPHLELFPRDSIFRAAQRQRFGQQQQQRARVAQRPQHLSAACADPAPTQPAKRARPDA